MRGRILPIAAATFLSIWLAMPACAATAAGTGLSAASGEPDAHLPEIDVEGHRQTVKRQMRHFVEQITRPDFLDVSLARWLQPMCPQVIGLPREAGESLLERISTIAADAQVPLGDSNCTPNLFIAFTSDPLAFLKAVQRKYPHVFQRDQQDGWPIVVNEFLSKKVPVRVWYNTRASRPNGSAILNDTLHASDGRDYTSNVNLNIASTRLQFPQVQSFEYVVVTVDTTMTQGMSLAAVGDYAAMVGLMELQPGASAGSAPSILTVFDASKDRPKKLTAWDASFLWGLYSTEQRDHMQRDLIVDHMMQRVLP